MIEPTDFVAIGALGGVRELARLAYHLAPRSPEYSADAARAAAQILERATVDEIAWLGRHRDLVAYEYLPADHHKAYDLGEPPLRPDSVTAPLVALLTLHWSGYVREAATRLLATRKDGGELPFLLLRVNDWVPEVQRLAEAAVRERVHPSCAAHFVRCIGLVAELRVMRRNSLSGLADDIEALLAGEASRGAMLEALESQSMDVRRAAARVAVRSGDRAFLRRAIASRDPVVARIGARTALEAWSTDEVRELLPVLRRGGPALRWLAVAAACDKLPREAEPLLREALFDSSGAVRELGRYRWEKIGLAPMDFPALYLQAISAAENGPSRSLAVAMRGLAETTTGHDGALFERHLHHLSAAVRTAAVLGLGRAADARYNDALCAAMDDPSNDVAAEARRWVKLRFGRAAVRARPAQPRGPGEHIR